MNENKELTRLLTKTINRIETNKTMGNERFDKTEELIKLTESSTTERNEIYNKMKKEFIDKQHKEELENIKKRDKETIKELKKQNEKSIQLSKKGTELERNMVEKSKKEEDKQYKEILKDIINEYGIGEDVVREIFKLTEKNNFLIPKTIERCCRVCKILNIRNTDDLKEKEEDFSYLVFEF